ncbi:MAG: PaaI family thioesterase [Proteobacteria bacterium]|nr:PaaI family thioesterase [Pseudomonadota bacterium]MBU4471073.1 PaaI family thioesterase [Pseudomonadota bacterium]MCG2753673.1 PaaI family thioesterase [Desulfobacteraceae bacterium]
MTDKAIQDLYPEEFAHCYGCGRLNTDGMQIKSYWNGEESICHYTPQSHYTGGFPGNAYGGLISSLIDCHGAATASAAKLQDDGFSLNDRAPYRFVTASLKVDYLKPTPLGKVLELKGRAKEISRRKVIVAVTLSAEGEVCAKGECIMVQLPEDQVK